MSKSHSGDAWMKIIGIGEHNVKKSKGKNPENTKGWGTEHFLQLPITLLFILTFLSFDRLWLRRIYL